MTCYEKLSLIITATGVAAAIGVLIVYGFQLRAMRESVTAAKQAADAVMAGQRAFVATTAYWALDESHPPNARFGVILRNVGNLPTVKLRNYIDFRIVEGELPEQFLFPDDVAPLTSGAMLVPKDQMFGPHIPKEELISSADLAAIQRGANNLYYFGWVKYFDGFAGTPERITKFCYRLHVTGEPKQPFTFIPHSRHNCADDGCKDDK
jgi:hypothetical protein